MKNLFPAGVIREANFDGLVGPTHHYAGQSFGNQASMIHEGKKSFPRKAALEGIGKAARVRDLGIPQAMLPPIRRPRLSALYDLGFRGSDEELIEKAFRVSPKLVSALYSASSMWVANAGTFSPEFDTADGKNHFTAANLSAKYHRSVEASATERIFRDLFSGPSFQHHRPLPSFFSDEGAANHGRLTEAHGKKGIELFVYGASRFETLAVEPKKFPARQQKEASEAIVRNHALAEADVLFIQQNPEAIDTGVFHNDVTSVVNENVFFLHEKSFVDQEKFKTDLSRRWKSGKTLRFIEMKESRCSISECVKSYLFNSQLITLPSGKMKLICPLECEESDSTRAALSEIMAQHSDVLEGYETFSLRESMQNGGGPACLRLRIVLSTAAQASVSERVWLTKDREAELKNLVQKYYREELSLADLRDPKFLLETRIAFDALEGFFGIQI